MCEKEELHKEEENEVSDKENEPPSRKKEEKLLPSKPVKKRKRLQKVQAEVEENTELELEEDIQRPSMPPKKKKVGKPKLQQVGPCALLQKSCIFTDFTH